MKKQNKITLENFGGGLFRHGGKTFLKIKREHSNYVDYPEVLSLVGDRVTPKDFGTNNTEVYRNILIEPICEEIYKCLESIVSLAHLDVTNA